MLKHSKAAEILTKFTDKIEQIIVLTELGRTLKPIHDTMAAWGNLYKKEISKA